jgi:hypothetical protein
MKRQQISLIALVFFTAAAAVAPASTTWIEDGVAICTAWQEPGGYVIAPDGAGGAIIAWFDQRAGTFRVYAQRIDASGEVRWTADGEPVSLSTWEQRYPSVLTDGAGGAIIAWSENRGLGYDVYAQRFDPLGAKLWNTDGVPICWELGNQERPKLVIDGVGGAVVAWMDNRVADTGVYAQRLNSSGTVLWDTLGIALCTAVGNRQDHVITTDRMAGAIVAWEDYRDGNADIYIRRVDALGTAQWTADGVALCTDPMSQRYPAIVSDNWNGAIVTWQDYRDTTESDIYAQRVNYNGATQWTADGEVISDEWSDERYPVITTDGVAGAIIAWQDGRSGTGWDIYAQMIDAGGAVQWSTGGEPVSTAAYDQQEPAIVSDGVRGAVVTWQDSRLYSYSDIYAQRIDDFGRGLWTIDGVEVCGAYHMQVAPALTSDGLGGAIVVWRDTRLLTEPDLYAQAVDANGMWEPYPIIHEVRDVPGDQGGYINLAWDASRMDPHPYAEITHYTIWRALDTSAVLALIDAGATLAEGPEAVTSSTTEPVVRVGFAGAQTFYWELIDSHDAYQLSQYSKVVPTVFDSTAVCTEYHYFQVIAHTSDPGVYHVSQPDSGYSVDNIAPAMPQCLAGDQAVAPDGLELSWRANSEADLSNYAVYRGTSLDFIPDPGNRLCAPADTTWFDSEWRWDSGYYYKVSAVDVHGNESLYAVLGPDFVTGIDGAPLATYLAQNHPNPFNPSTTIAFGVDEPADVVLLVYDVSGRLVRVLADRRFEAGRFEERWDGRDDSGGSSASGVYFYQLRVGGKLFTKKMVLIR